MGYEGGDDGDVGASAWPGFVDILSSVLIMFVFFLMITAVTLNFHILIFKGKIKDGAKIVIAEVKKDAEKSIQNLTVENKVLKEKINDFMVQHISPDQQKKPHVQLADMSKNKTLDYRIDEKKKTLFIFFAPDSITIDDKISQKIQEFLDTYKNVKLVNIISSKNMEDRLNNISRKITISRIFNVRNSVMRAKISTVKIGAYMVDGQPIDGKANWVKVVVKTDKS